MAEQQRVVPFERLGMSDLAQVGGKNASLGEMIRHLAAEGVRVPGGFATTAFAFHEFIDASQLRPRIDAALAKLDVDDVKVLSSVGAEIAAYHALDPDGERDVRVGKPLMDPVGDGAVVVKGCEYLLYRLKNIL